MFTKEKQTLYHKWFAGYFPADKPKYALVVLHMDTPGDKALTNTVFYDSFVLWEATSITVWEEKKAQAIN